MSLGRLLLMGLGGIAIVIASFEATTIGLNWLAGPAGNEPASDNPIQLYGDAVASTPEWQESTVFEFKGNGIAKIRGTSNLHCLTKKCKLSAKVEFGSTTAAPQGEIIVGQSFHGEHGWHLLWTPGQLYLQGEGGAQIVVPFTPVVGQTYVITTTNIKDAVQLSINGTPVSAPSSSPFTDIARDVTVGGREAPGASAGSNHFVGKVSELKIDYLH